MAGNVRWKGLFKRGPSTESEDGEDEVSGRRIPKWSMGVLNDRSTIEVPGSVLLLSSEHNEPLGLRHAPARASQSSLSTGYRPSRPGTPRRSTGSRAPDPRPTIKKTSDGEIILDPQPEDCANDPLNWPTWRRDAALLSLGFYCMVGGGITPILAAGFADVGQDYDVEVETVALTTGLYMLGLGLGSVVASPTAILYGKRPVYLASAIIFILSCVWCALSPSFGSLVVARVFQGMAVSPVECLPSATIAEIFFLHERAYRIGIYTLLLLGGKNLVPLVSAVIIHALSWQWVFWIVAMVVAFGGVMLFLFVPETFWDRAPTAKPRGTSARPSRPRFLHRLSSRYGDHPAGSNAPPADVLESTVEYEKTSVDSSGVEKSREEKAAGAEAANDGDLSPRPQRVSFALEDEDREEPQASDLATIPSDRATPRGTGSADVVEETPAVGGATKEQQEAGKLDGNKSAPTGTSIDAGNAPVDRGRRLDVEKADYDDDDDVEASLGRIYTTALRRQPAQTFVQQLRPYHGRLSNDSWIRAMLRPFILFSYPAILWSAAVYACSVGWLIVISESMAMIYQNSDSYNFDQLQTGLVYLSPFVGGLLGTAVAGKVSDIIVKAMSRRNGGLYEPEFRLVMGIPILVTTVIGLMGFGWSAEERDHWIVPTVFFGVISFGCSLGSTTSITFCVDSYRQYAGEALVTLNFSKNVLHGLIFSLFFTHWLSADGSKMVFIWTGVIQLILMLTTIPLFIYGKRLRMWTVRKNFVEKVKT